MHLTLTPLCSPNNGSWNLNGQRFSASCKPLICWSVVNFTRQDCGPFVKFLIQTLRGLGMNIVNDAPPMIVGNPDPQSVRTTLEGAGKQAFAQAKAKLGAKAPPPQFFLCFMDRTDASLYEAIKRACAMQVCC